jgi:thiol-disulfide isomerase/thioredoxin
MPSLFGHEFRQWLVAAAVVSAASSVLPVRPAGGEEPAAKPAAKSQSDPFAVPDGTPEALLKYIEELKLERPTADSREVVRDFVKKQSGALLTAADKILAAKPNAEQAKAAVQYKLIALGMLGRLGDPDAEKKLAAMPDELTKAGYKALVRDVRIELLAQQLRRTDPADAEDFAKLLDEIKTFLAEGPLDPGDAHLAVETAMAAEASGDARLGERTYAEMAKILAKSDDRAIAKLAATLRGAARRLGLVGKPFSLQGTTVEGKPLDWKKYAGNVVLVDFFATWCGPCREEMPNIQENYDAYHARGFDVVGVSVDHDRNALDDFLSEHKHPWTVLLDATEAAGTDQSLATYYGIIGIPQTILVGKDGKVVTLAARGPDLRRELEKLLGPVKEKAKEKD